MNILLCVLGKLLPQISIHCTQWSSRLCKVKQLFYGVNGNVVFRAFFIQYLPRQSCHFPLCLQAAPKANCKVLELIKRLNLMELLSSSPALPKRPRQLNLTGNKHCVRVIFQKMCAPWQAGLLIITLQECKVSYLAATPEPLGRRIIVMSAGWHRELSAPVSPHSSCEGTPQNMSAPGWLSSPKWNICEQDKFMRMSANWSSVVLTTCQALGAAVICVHG